MSTRKKKTRKKRGGTLVGEIIIAPIDVEYPNLKRQKLRILSTWANADVHPPQIWAKVQNNEAPTTGATGTEFFTVSLTELYLNGWTGPPLSASTGSTSGGRKKTRKKRGRGKRRHRKRGKRKKKKSRRKKRIESKKKYYIKNPKTPPKKIKCCAGPGCPEHLHCINVIGIGSKKYPFVYKKT